MDELKENRLLHIEIGIASEIFDKSNSKTSMQVSNVRLCKFLISQVSNVNWLECKL